MAERDFKFFYGRSGDESLNREKCGILKAALVVGGFWWNLQSGEIPRLLGLSKPVVFTARSCHSRFRSVFALSLLGMDKQRVKINQCSD